MTDNDLPILEHLPQMPRELMVKCASVVLAHSSSADEAKHVLHVLFDRTSPTRQPGGLRGRRR